MERATQWTQVACPDETYGRAGARDRQVVLHDLGQLAAVGDRPGLDRRLLVRELPLATFTIKD